MAAMNGGESNDDIHDHTRQCTIRSCNRLMPVSRRLCFLTKEQLREALNLPSTRMIDELVRKRKIPVIRLGHRTVRFDLVKVEAALDRLEFKEVGRK